MRRLLLAFALLLTSGSGWAQQVQAIVVPITPQGPPSPVAGSYRFRTDSLMAALDKTQVPTGILYDRVLPIARLDVFGQTTADTSGLDHFMQANQELWYSSYRKVGLGASATLRIRAREHRQAGIVPIGLLHYRFNLLDTLAVQNNLLSQPGGDGGALYDVPGRPQLPYITRENLVAAALAEAVPAGTVQFGLPTNLLLDNTSNPVQYLTLNFLDGTSSATLTPGGAGVYKSYLAAGTYFIQLIAHFADGSSKTNVTSIQIKGDATASRGGRPPEFQLINPCSPSSDIVRLDAGESFLDYEGRLYSGVGETTTYYANCNNRQLTKPIIMLDGIDFDDEEQRSGVEVYSDFLNYYEQGIPKRLGEELRASGNDVVILDFPDANGAEYIQRNAYVLIQLIQNINAELRSRSLNPEKLTVIGPSMSGLVSRYALAEMERRFNDPNNPGYQQPEWNHNTRLWMSFDSPQLGANIPIGDQQWIEYYAEVGEIEAAEKNLKNIDRPATKQMLVQHYKSTSNTVSGAPGFRDRFQSELNNLGMPTQLRRISVINGSMAGVRQDWRDNSRKSNGCDQAFSFEAKTGRPRLFHINWLPSPFPPIGRITLSTSSVHFSPDYGGGCTTFRGTLLGSSRRARYSVGRPSSISYDVAPGSWRPTQSTLAEEGTATDDKLDGFVKNFFLSGPHRTTSTSRFYDVIGKHCFIPTVSALALTNTSRDLGQNLSSTDLVCSGQTPFDAYFAPLQNEEHIFITPANAEFIKNEIGAVTPKPVFASAPTSSCPNGTTQFSVKPECSRNDANGNPVFSVGYVWTSSDSRVQIVSGQGTSTISVQAQPGFEGNATLSVVATRTGFTQSQPAFTSLHVGPATLQPTSNTGADPVCRGADVVFTAEVNNVPTSSLQWEIHGGSTGNTVTSYNGVREVVYRLKFSDKRVYAVLRGTDACTGAAIAPVQLDVNVDLYCGNSNREVSMYPNPANEQVDVALVSEQQQRGAGPGLPAGSDPADAFELTIFDGRGRPLREARTSTGQLRLDTRNLAPGLYHVQVRWNNRVFNRPLSIQR